MTNEPPPPETILAVNLAREDLASLRHILDALNWDLLESAGRAAAQALLESRPIPVVLSNHKFPDGDWKHLLKIIDRLSCPPRLIVCSHFADERLWAEVLNLGGHDVLPLPFNREETTRVLKLAWLRSRREWQWQQPVTPPAGMALRNRTASKPLSSETSHLRQAESQNYLSKRSAF
jgi:response regulator RpfG family c-di-GMP phosphodiesterase